jgi:hypothetical protein
MKVFIVFVGILFIASSSTIQSTNNGGFSNFITNSVNPTASVFNQGSQYLASAGSNLNNFGGSGGGAINIPVTIQMPSNFQR